MVINADSAQVYRDLDVVSARPGADELARAEHRLYGYRDGALPCSAAEWAAEAKGAIAEVHSLGKLPILAGGTGLYLRTLLEGIAPVPDIDPAIRSEIRARSVDENLAELKTLDPLTAGRLRSGDTTRIGRALEVVRSTGRTITEWQAQRVGGIAGEADLRPLILLPPREWLNERCDRRFTAMIKMGAITEIERLLARSLDPELPVMRAIGVREIADFLHGTSNRDEMIAAGQLATRQYAKRQYTWFRNQPPAEWPRLTDPLEEDASDRALALLI